MAVAERYDPYVAFRFKVEIEGIMVAGFSEVTGLSNEREVETFREGGNNHFEQQLAGPGKFPARLVLKRGLGEKAELWSWYQDVLNGRIKRKQVTILMLDSTGAESRRWVFYQACPVKWSGPDFRGGSAEVAFEAVELVHQGILRSD